MQLEFEYVQVLGAGLSPQVVHMMDNGLQVIYLKTDGTVAGIEAYPPLGIYDALSFSSRGRLSSDINISHPSLKKQAHYGAYGFWSANGDHRFVMYMLPVDISTSVLNLNVSCTKGCVVSQLSASLQNLKNELINRSRIIITPNSILEVGISYGSSETLAMGKFHIDRVMVGYPDQEISVSARNAIGKLLKEQTFDENLAFTGTLQENLAAILALAGVEDFFVADPQKAWKLSFKAQETLIDGILDVIQLLPAWKIQENAEGTVGIGPVSDLRFDQLSTYQFERDKTCFSYSVEYDDEQIYGKICLICNSPAFTLYKSLEPYRWWAVPLNRTLYVTVPDGTSQADMEVYAEELAQSVAISGRIESFVGIFTPHMLIGDSVELVEPDGRKIVIGTVTAFKHSLGRSGFYTEFSVDSGGRKGKLFLKDLITKISGEKKVTGVVIS